MGQSIGKIFLDAIKNLSLTFFKLCGITFAWLCKIAGMILLKMGETIEKLIVK